MISKIFEWAWINGLDIRLESKNYAIPVRDQGRFLPRREAPNYVDHEKMVLESPCIVFSRGDLHQMIQAPNWAMMIESLKYRHKQIFAELGCKALEL